MARKYPDDEIQSFTLKTFDGGYNSYSASKTFIKDNEIPQGAQNVVVDDNGSITKRGGKSRYGDEHVSGKAIMGLGRLKNTSHNKVIVAVGTVWTYNNGTTTTDLTGASFTADKPTDFENADGKLWGANNTEGLSYTSDGAAATTIASNGNTGRWPVFYNKRIYMTNATFPDRVYYSNPSSIDLTANPPTYTGLDVANMFNTNLGATPRKDAGYIILMPLSGLAITRLYRDNVGGNDYIFAETKEHGKWRIAQTADSSASAGVTHSVVQVVPGSKCPAGRSVVKQDNDTWFYDGFNFNTYGEAATYQNPRITVKGGRVQSEVASIAASGRDAVAAIYYDSKVYFAYQTGSYNDRVIVYDTILNVWSAPWTNMSISCFLIHEEDDGTRRLLAGSSNSSDSYVYEIETGTNDISTAINAIFQTKATDCGQAGLVKYFGFIDVFAGSVFGTLTYEVLVDEITSVTGSLQLGNSSSLPVGIGTQPVATFPVAQDFSSATTFASQVQNYQFRIPCEYVSGKRIAVEFSNNVASENFKINAVRAWFIPGSIYQT